MQQNIKSQREALELATKLEALPIGDGDTSMVHIQSQLDNLTIQLQGIKKGKESRKELWCTKCRTNGHTKDKCSKFMNNVASSTPNPLNGQGLPWCHICQSRGHRDEECIYLQKVVSTCANLFYKFCKSVGHEEKDYRAYQLLIEKTIDMYLMKNEGFPQVEQA